MNHAHLFDRLATLVRERRPFALATVVGARGSGPRTVGTRMIIHGDGTIEGTIGGGRFESLVVEAATEMLRERCLDPVVRDYPLHEHADDSFGAVCGGTMTVFLEPMVFGPRVVCVGAGHCARALAAAVAALGWDAEIVEDRAALLSTETFPTATRLHLVADVPAALDALPLDRATAVCLINRNHLLDRDCLGRLLARLRPAPDDARPFYVGMIGSRRKVERVFGELRDAGATDEQLAGVRAPIGLEIGADSPAEIAVSITAELIAAWRALHDDARGAAARRPPASA